MLKDLLPYVQVILPLIDDESRLSIIFYFFVKISQICVKRNEVPLIISSLFCIVGLTARCFSASSVHNATATGTKGRCHPYLKTIPLLCLSGGATVTCIHLSKLLYIYIYIYIYICVCVCVCVCKCGFFMNGYNWDSTPPDHILSASLQD